MYNCYAKTKVSGITHVGGLAGRHRSKMSNSYATGPVSGATDVGGLVGWFSYGIISNCYSTGAVSGGTTVGGLVGVKTSGTITNSFWDVDSSSVYTSAGGTGETTAKMQDPNTFVDAGWDFVGETVNGVSDFWAAPDGGGYMVLWWQLSPLPALPTFSGGFGTAEDPYLISTAGELNSIGHNPRLMASHFKLVNDIDLAGISFFPIGSEAYPFAAVFDGSNRKISNFTYSSTGTDYTGLFASASGKNMQIKDLCLVDPNVAAGTGGYVGSLAGWAQNGTISACQANNISVSARGHYVGGLVGRNIEVDLTDCASSGSVSGFGNYVGGLVGYNTKGDLTNCTSSCSVSGQASYVGGLVGTNYGGKLADCTSAGSVSGDRYVGGFLGISGADDDRIFNCTSSSSVTGGSTIGGLVGRSYGTIMNCSGTGDVSATGGGAGGLAGGNYGTLADCFATGTVSAASGSAGGLVGGNSGRVADCFATGDVSGNENVGGLVGYAGGDSTTTRCFATGNVIGDDAVSGLVGEIQGAVTDCYTTGSVAGNSSVGGLAGYIHDNGEVKGRILRCFSTGPVSGGSYVGGLVGTNTGTVDDCFWDTQTSQLSKMCGRQVGLYAAGCDNTKGRTTAQMQHAATFTAAGWDFAGVWDICEATDYPRLTWQVPLLGDSLCPRGVDFADFAYLATHWLDGDCNVLNLYCEATDLDRSGAVDVDDLGIFTKNWLEKGWETAFHKAILFHEDFETGDFSRNQWQHSGDGNWVVVSDIAYEGDFCARSGAIADYQQSVLEVTVDSPAKWITFYCKVSSEEEWDNLRFYIDGELKDEWSGEIDWEVHEYTIEAGRHTFRWEYKKDESFFGGSDCAWIDAITCFRTIR